MKITDGIEGVVLTTHSWGKSAKFFQSLGFELDFETDHSSGQLRNGDGPFLFIAEVPESEKPALQVILRLAGADAANRLDSIIDVVTPLDDTHWGTKEMTVRDPDGREWSLQTAAGSSTP